MNDCIILAALKINKLKKLIIPFLAAVALLSACKKKETTTTTGQYYFKGTLDGQSIGYSSSVPQYMSAYSYNAGGYVINGDQLFSTQEISLAFQFDHAVTNADMLALAGQNISFDPAASPHAEIDYEPIVESTDSAEYYSVDTTATAYSVHVNSISFVKSDVALDSVDVYLINGTCNAMMHNHYAGNKTFSNGSFNFLISRRKN